jgi:hypothetical protein
MFRRVSKLPSRLQKERQTFQFEVQLVGFQGSPRRRAVVLQLQRGLRTATSQPFETNPAGQRVALDESLSIICSLYRDRKTGKFESKDCKLRLLTWQAPGKRQPSRGSELSSKALEKVHFDLVMFLGELGSGVQREHVFVLSNGSRIFARVCLSWMGSALPSGSRDSVSSYAPSELSQWSVESTLWSDDSESSAEASTLSKEQLHAQPVQPSVVLEPTSSATDEHANAGVTGTLPATEMKRRVSSSVSGPDERPSTPGKDEQVFGKKEGAISTASLVGKSASSATQVLSPSTAASQEKSARYATDQDSGGHVRIEDAFAGTGNHGARPSSSRTHGTTNGIAPEEERTLPTAQCAAHAAALARTLSLLTAPLASESESGYETVRVAQEIPSNASPQITGDEMDTAETVTLAWKKCASLVSALSGLSHQLSVMRAHLQPHSTASEHQHPVALAEQQPPGRAVGSVRTSQPTRSDLGEGPNSQAPLARGMEPALTSVVTLRKQLKHLSDAVLERDQILQKRYSHQLRKVVIVLQRLSGTELPALYQHVEHCFDLTASQIAGLLERLRRHRSMSVTRPMACVPSERDPRLENDSICSTLRQAKVELKHLRKKMHMLQGEMQQQAQEACERLQRGRVSVEGRLARVTQRQTTLARKLSKETSDCRAHLFAWRLQWEAFEKDMLQGFQELHHALQRNKAQHVFVQQNAASFSPAEALPERISIRMQRPRHQVLRLKTELLLLKSTCTKAIDQWQQWWASVVASLAHVKASSCTIQAQQSTLNQIGEKAAVAGQAASGTHGVTAYAVNADVLPLSFDEHALLQELIETKVELAQQREHEENLRRDMRRQQRDYQNVITKLGETVSKLEVRLARKRMRQKNLVHIEPSSYT